MRTYCLDHQKKGDDVILFLMFAAFESMKELLGLSPFELIFGHSARGPLKLIKEKMVIGRPKQGTFAGLCRII